MKLKLLLFQFFILIFILFICSDFVLSFSNDIEKKNILIHNAKYLDFYTNKKNEKKIFLLKKNECFSFLESNKNTFFKQEKIIINNKNFIGFFRGDRFKIFYIVKLKDTLYSISKKSGHNYHELSQYNSIKKPYKINVGQKIWVGDFLINSTNNNCSITSFNKNSISCASIFKKSLDMFSFFKKNAQYKIKSTKICFFSSIKLKKNFCIFSEKWNWPVKENKIKYFYNSKLNDKKIEIFGFKGQPIFTAAAGEVMYVGDLFKKYGRLIIIRHDSNYLSIYAFNDLILVKQKDKVCAQQNIATMGVSRQNIPQLYFEIRYKGKSVNPLFILPKMNTKK